MKKSNFERAVLPHREVLYRQALRLTHRRDDAEDLVQETLLRAFRSFSSFQSTGTVCQWLLTILQNRFISGYRSAKRTPPPVFLDALENPESLLPHEPGPEKEVLSGIEYEAVCRAVAELPPDFRRVLILADFQGLKYREIGDYLGISMGTVRSRLFHARNRVRRSLFAWRPDAQQRTNLFRS